MKTGIKYILSFILLVFQPQVVDLLIMPFKSCYNRYLARNAILHKDCKTYSTGPVFKLTGKYANTICIIYIAITFSSGIPLLLGITSMIFIVRLILYKYFVLRYNSRPER